VEYRRVPQNKKCSNCVYSGRKCEQDFYPQEKWAKLDKARDKVNAELVTTGNKLLFLEQEHEELLKIHKRMSKNQIDISRVLKKHS
jgi:hypothetical protein